jgi:hypothetical protein
LHFTPNLGSWLNLVEVFFGIITRQAIRRGTFASVKDLVAAIRRFIEGTLTRRRQHAELVALRVGEHYPGLLALSDVDPLRAEADEALDLRVTVIWAEVKVQPVLHYLSLRDSDEQQPRAPIGHRTDLELLGIVVHDHPAERVQPPAAEGSGIARVDDDLFPLDAHPESVVRRGGHQV